MSHLSPGDASTRPRASDARAPGRPRTGSAWDGHAPPSNSYVFWVLFALGWLGWVGVMGLPSAVEGEPVAPPIASTVGPILLAILVARWRRKLLRPDAPLAGTVLAHVAVGIAFAVVSAFISAVLVQLVVTPGETFWNGSLSDVIPYLSVVHLILYVVLAGFLMWTESIRQVQESHARLAHEAVLRAQAEVKALRAQFNPHFVLNTLHSLMILVRTEPAAAERAIEDVGELIRYAARLEKRDQDTVPLQKEIEIAKRYLALEKLRLADRLEVSWEIHADPERYYVPSFSLQTLLENAIKHGLSPKPEGGTVGVTIDMDGRQLVVSVQDNGMGAEPTAVLDGEGRGLSLLARRLDALYGSAASLTWSTAPEQGFSVGFSIPLAGAVDGAPDRIAAARTDTPLDAQRSENRKRA